MQPKGNNRRAACWLWFDVEERYNATSISLDHSESVLWFDVEERYNATFDMHWGLGACCGLM